MGYFSDSLNVTNAFNNAKNQFSAANTVLGANNKNIVGASGYSAYHKQQSAVNNVSATRQALFQTNVKIVAQDLATVLAQMDVVTGLLEEMGTLAATATDTSMLDASTLRDEVNTAYVTLGTLVNSLAGTIGVSVSGSDVFFTANATNSILFTTATNFTLDMIDIDATALSINSGNSNLDTAALSVTAVAQIGVALARVGGAVQNVAAGVIGVNAGIALTAASEALNKDYALTYKAPDSFSEATSLNQALATASNSSSVLSNYLNLNNIEGSLIQALLR